MLNGLFIGFIIGFVTCLIFFWRLGVDADKKYTEGTARWDAGTQAYKEAVRVLEVNREEKATHRETMRRCWTNLFLTLEKHIPHEGMVQIRHLSSFDDVPAGS
jgi:gas vesicle protein